VVRLLLRARTWSRLDLDGTFQVEVVNSDHGVREYERDQMLQCGITPFCKEPLREDTIKHLSR
jgi:hypothetical protein